MAVRTVTDNTYPNKLNKLKSQPIFSEPPKTEWHEQFRYLFTYQSIKIKTENALKIELNRMKVLFEKIWNVYN